MGLISTARRLGKPRKEVTVQDLIDAGFDFNDPQYHGTSGGWDQFTPDKPGFVSSNPEVAADYAMQGKFPNVRKLFTKGKRATLEDMKIAKGDPEAFDDDFPFIHIDPEYSGELIEPLKEKGFSGVDFDWNTEEYADDGFGPTKERVLFDPNEDSINALDPLREGRSIKADTPEGTVRNLIAGGVPQDQALDAVKKNVFGLLSDADLENIVPSVGAGVSLGAIAVGMTPEQVQASEPQQPKPEPEVANNKAFFRNTLPADLEAIASIGSSAILEPFAGLAGIAGSLLSGPQGQGIDWINKIQGLAYEPDDASTLQQIASGLQVPLEAYEKGTDWLGEQGGKIGGPTGATIGKVLPEIIGGGFALKQLMKGVPKVDQPEAGQPEADQPKVDQPDLSRRNFLKTAGLLSAGAVAANAIPGKSLMDSLSKAPVGKTAAVARAIPKVSGANFNLASFLQNSPFILNKIKKGEYDTNSDGSIYVEDPDGQVNLYTGPMPDKATIDMADTGNFEIDTDTIKRTKAHTPDALERYIDSMGSLNDYRTYKDVDAFFKDVNSPAEGIMSIIGNGVGTGKDLAHLHPADVKKAYQALAKKHPDIEIFKKLGDMDNQELLKRGASNWQEGTMTYNGEIDDDIGSWVYKNH